jgi:amidase
MNTNADTQWLDATALATLVRERKVSPFELVSAAIARAERLDPLIHAILTPLYEQALECAKNESALSDGPFRGVPFLIKDICASIAGVRMTSGSAFTRDFVSPFDSELVVRYRKAGLVFLGKTITPEFGFVPTTEPKAFGRCKNPWNLERTTGGSSGGSAAAVAAGIVPFAHANDGGGSIRIPASCCGLFGLKPSRARITLAPMIGDVMGGLVAEHAVTRSVRDSAALLDATEGPSLGDPYFALPKARPFAAEVDTPPGKLRIAFTTDSVTNTPVHPECVHALTEAMRLCEELGHEVVQTKPPIESDMLMPAFLALWASGAAATIDMFAMTLGREPKKGELEPLSEVLVEMGRSTPAGRYLIATGHLQRVARQIAHFMVDFDVLATPTLAEPPLPLGTLDAPDDDPMSAFFRAGQFAPFTAMANVTGQPAMSVPLSWNPEGLPIGVHFVGRQNDEATLFRLAGQLERAQPWAGRRPPIC